MKEWSDCVCCQRWQWFETIIMRIGFEQLWKYTFTLCFEAFRVAVVKIPKNLSSSKSTHFPFFFRSIKGVKRWLSVLLSHIIIRHPSHYMSHKELYKDVTALEDFGEESTFFHGTLIFSLQWNIGRSILFNIILHTCVFNDLIITRHILVFISVRRKFSWLADLVLLLLAPYPIFYLRKLFNSFSYDLEWKFQKKKRLSPRYIQVKLNKAK